jgi:hypothetical protein
MYLLCPTIAFPSLHEEIQHELRGRLPSIWAAYKEPRPRDPCGNKDQKYYVRRELPPGATPFNEPALAG